MNKTALITGSSGFIGFHLSNFLLSNNWKVIGFDAMTNYYDVKLKKNRYKILDKHQNFFGYCGLIQDKIFLNKITVKHQPNIIIHLAAQAGVRYSIENPDSYAETNLLGTFNILELARRHNIDHLLLASTSSVYGNSKDLPYNENQKSDNPISFYAATKKSTEIMAHSYSHLFQIPTTIFRFFTVYGPWGRPDMALFKFVNKILSNKPIDIYNYGKMQRDFTYIDDLVNAIGLLIDTIPPVPDKRKIKNINDSISETAPYRIINIGSSKSINLIDYISEIEEALGIIAKKNFLGLQDGDVKQTFSNTSLLYALTGFKAKKNIKDGVREFISWYKSYYK